jgi:hypothetical protein
MISGRGGTNGKPVWSGSTFEERTGTSTEGSRTYGCSTGGFRNLEIQRSGAQATANDVSCSTPEDCGSTTDALGEVEGSEDEGGLTEGRVGVEREREIRSLFHFGMKGKTLGDNFSSLRVSQTY